MLLAADAAGGDTRLGDRRVDDRNDISDPSLLNRSENFVGSDNKTFDHHESDAFDHVETDSEKGKWR